MAAHQRFNELGRGLINRSTTSAS